MTLSPQLELAQRYALDDRNLYMHAATCTLDPYKLGKMTDGKISRKLEKL